MSDYGRENVFLNKEMITMKWRMKSFMHMIPGSVRDHPTHSSESQEKFFIGISYSRVYF